MKIADINLDDLDRTEYLHFLQTLVEYFYVQFGEELEIRIKGSDEISK